MVEIEASEAGEYDGGGHVGRGGLVCLIEPGRAAGGPRVRAKFVSCWRFQAKLTTDSCSGRRRGSEEL